MDKSRMRVSAPISGRQVSDKSAATRMPPRLARRSFLVVVGFALAGALLNANTARAKDCDRLVRENQCCQYLNCTGTVLSDRTDGACKRFSHGQSYIRAKGGFFKPGHCSNL